MLLIDGVKYQEWTPKSEEEFEQIISEHASEIFSENSMYFDRKLKLQSLSGIGSIPDGYVIVFGDSLQWHIIEVELSSHPLYNHIVPQISKFISGINNLSTQKMITDALFHAIIADAVYYARVEKVVQTGEIYKFVADLISKPPVLTIIIEKDTEELREALSTLRYPQIKVVEFQTFVREGVGFAVHAHLFEPLYQVITPKVTIVSERGEVTPTPTPPNSVEVIVRNPSDIRFHLFGISKPIRRFFPGYKIPFELETDIGTIKTWVSSAPEGTAVGDPDKGAYIQANLAEWYRRHSTIQVGDKVIITAIEPMKKYRLEVLK